MAKAVGDKINIFLKELFHCISIELSWKNSDDVLFPVLSLWAQNYTMSHKLLTVYQAPKGNYSVRKKSRKHLTESGKISLPVIQVSVCSWCKVSITCWNTGQIIPHMQVLGKGEIRDFQSLQSLQTIFTNLTFGQLGDPQNINETRFSSFLHLK